jgi:plastin-1
LIDSLQQVASAGKTSRIESFKDPSIATGRFLVDLLYAINPRAVNYSLVEPGDTCQNKFPFFFLLFSFLVPDSSFLLDVDEQCALNAQYVVNVAWKIGCYVFILWEDIVEVKPDMIFVFVAALMMYSK